MMKFHVYGKVVGTKYLGTVEAESEKEAIRKVENGEGPEMSVQLCHHCSSQCEDPEIDDITVDACDDEN